MGAFMGAFVGYLVPSLHETEGVPVSPDGGKSRQTVTLGFTLGF